MYDNVILAEKCFRVRNELGLSQKKFAERLGTSQSYIAFIERGYCPQGFVLLSNLIDLLYALLQDCNCKLYVMKLLDVVFE